MDNTFPGAVPEIPVSDLQKAGAYYQTKLGFNIDWYAGEHHIMGVSKGQCRLFLTDDAFRTRYGNAVPIIVWFNLDSIEPGRRIARALGGQRGNHCITARIKVLEIT